MHKGIRRVYENTASWRCGGNRLSLLGIEALGDETVVGAAQPEHLCTSQLTSFTVVVRQPKEEGSRSRETRSNNNGIIIFKNTYQPLNHQQDLSKCWPWNTYTLCRKGDCVHACCPPRAEPVAFFM